MQQENMKTLESLEDFRHFSEKELEIRFDQLKKQIVPADKTIREQAEKPGNQKGTRCPADALFCFLGIFCHLRVYSRFRRFSRM